MSCFRVARRDGAQDARRRPVFCAACRCRTSPPKPPFLNVNEKLPMRRQSSVPPPRRRACARNSARGGRTPVPRRRRTPLARWRCPVRGSPRWFYKRRRGENKLYGPGLLVVARAANLPRWSRVPSAEASNKALWRAKSDDGTRPTRSVNARKMVGQKGRSAATAKVTVKVKTETPKTPKTPPKTAASPLRVCFKRRRACKVPPKAMVLPSKRTLSAAELAALSDEELLRRAHADIVLPARERGVRLGMYGNHCVFPDEAEEAEEAARASPSSTPTRCDWRARPWRLFSSTTSPACGCARRRSRPWRKTRWVWVLGNGEGIVACLLRGGAAEFRRDDLHATLYLPGASASGKS